MWGTRPTQTTVRKLPKKAKTKINNKTKQNKQKTKTNKQTNKQKNLCELQGQKTAEYCREPKPKQTTSSPQPTQQVIEITMHVTNDQ